jgi:prepilin signal peptidase PulO-like enzyme (type II secretory pathway)
MWPIILLSTAVGVIAGRGIVAETSAHRADLPDNWIRPECEVCGSGLTLSMTRCSANRHTQPWYLIGISLMSGGVFGLMAWAVPTLAVLPAFLVFAATMVTLTVTDLQTKLIPNRILGPATAIGVVLLVVGALVSGDVDLLIGAAIGGITYFGVMFLMAVIARGALGFGDVKLSLIIGVFTGYISLGSVLVAGGGAFILGGLLSVILILTRTANRKDLIPFGPFMTTAAIIATVWGPTIATWYRG